MNPTTFKQGPTCVLILIRCGVVLNKEKKATISIACVSVSSPLDEAVTMAAHDEQVGRHLVGGVADDVPRVPALHHRLHLDVRVASADALGLVDRRRRDGVGVPLDARQHVRGHHVPCRQRQAGRRSSAPLPFSELERAARPAPCDLEKSTTAVCGSSKSHLRCPWRRRPGAGGGHGRAPACRLPPVRRRWRGTS